MSDLERRGFCRGGAGWLAGAVVLAGLESCAGPSQRKDEEKKAEGKEEKVSPAEDLMREHGVLNRVLLIYEEAIRRLKVKENFDPDVLAGSAKLIRNFVEDYHEKLEEDFLFPRFEKAGKLVDLAGVLRAQHGAGRRLTDQIRALATLQALKNSKSRGQLSESLQLFVRMYRPHEAREDTVLFPALRTIVSANEYDSLGEEFEDKEHELFGEDGFEKIVEEVGKLERAFGIYDLAKFTPGV